MIRTALAAVLVASTAPAHAREPAVDAATYAAIDRIFQDWMLDQHVPGLAYAIVDASGRILHAGTFGVQAIETGAPVTPDTAFRIASMSKAPTAYAIMQLAGQGRLSLEDPVAAHVPEAGPWAQHVRIRQLLHHTAGFVTDNPWGDRQQSASPAEFTAMLASDMPFDAAPGTRYSYSNFGYATLGRIITNLSGKPYQAHIAQTQWQPLGMASTTFDVTAVPDAGLARGYRWTDGKWLPEPVMADGEFGAMGGMVTTAGDYAHWVGHLLSGWPAKPAAADIPARRNVRAMREGGGFTHNRRRPGKDASDCATAAMVYAAGLVAGQDCVLGAVMFHSGGYPGYGSHMLLLPDAGVGIYAFANRTYAAPTGPVWDAAGRLRRAGLAEDRPVPVTAELAAGYRKVQQIWSTGRIDSDPGALAVNMLMDRPAASWNADLAALKTNAGRCDTAGPPIATSAMAGRFQWRCATGRISGSFLLAPVRTVQLQELFFQRAAQ